MKNNNPQKIITKILRLRDPKKLESDKARENVINKIDDTTSEWIKKHKL